MKTNITKVIVLLTLLISAIGLVVASIIFKLQDTNISKIEQSIDIKGIKKLEIQSYYTDIKVSIYDGEELYLAYKGQEKDLKTSKESEKLKIDLGIESRNKIKFYLPFASLNTSLDLKIPKDSIKNIEIESDAGKINISGDFLDVNLSASAGSIKFDGNANKIEMKADAGSINFNGFTKDMNAKADVGSIDIKLDKIDGTYYIESDVGSIDLSLPKDGELSLSATSDMGYIDNKFIFDNISQTGKNFLASKGSGKAKIYLKTDVGTIDISEN